MKKLYVLFFPLLLNGCTKQITEPGNGGYITSRQTSVSSLTISQPDKTEELERTPESFMVQEENYFDYQPGPECAAFSSAYLLRYYGEDASGLELYENFPSKLPDGNGVYPQGITDFFKSLGYEAEYITDGDIDDLKSEIAKGAPVIVFIHGIYPYTTVHNTHYVCVVGYDEDHIYISDSLSDLANCKEDENLLYNRKTSIVDFKNLWLNIDGLWDNPYYSIKP